MKKASSQEKETLNLIKNKNIDSSHKNKVENENIKSKIQLKDINKIQNNPQSKISEKNENEDNNENTEKKNKIKNKLKPIFVKTMPTINPEEFTLQEFTYPVINSCFKNAGTLLNREPIFSSANNCLFKAILVNLEVSSYLHYELRQFIVKCIDENMKNLTNNVITEEILLKRKNEILEKNEAGQDIDIYIIANYLNINVVILNQNYIVKKIIQINSDLYINLYFLKEDNDNHIEPLTQYNILNKFSELKFRVNNLVKALVSFKEKNDKIVVFNFDGKKENKNKTIPEIDNLKINIFADAKPVVKYEVINEKAFKKIIKFANSIEYEDLIARINATSAVCKKIKLTYNNYSEENDNNKSDNDDDEILTIEAGIAQNLICAKCSKIFLLNNCEYHILKYYEDIVKLRKHINSCHKNFDKNKLGINLVFYKGNYTLLKRGHGSYLEFLMVSITLIKNFYYIFDEIDKIKNEKIKINNLIINKNDDINNNLNNGELNNNKKRKNEIRGYNFNELKIFPEKDISINLINNLIPNYLSQVPEDLYITPEEIFDEDEIENCNMYIVKSDIKSDDFKKYPNYKELTNLPYFSCGSCNFIDKYGNYNFKLSAGYRSYKKHNKLHVNYLKKGSFLFKNIPKNYTIIRTNNNHKVLYGIADDSIKRIKEEKEKIRDKNISIDQTLDETYGSKKIPNGISIIGWNCVAVGSPHNLFMINKYLEECSPDFILLNEVGNYEKNNLKIHEKYDIIIKNRYIGIIHKRKFKITKICTNLLDDFVLITRVQKENNNESLIIIVIYNSPNKYNIIRNRNLPNIIRLIIEKYKNPSFVLYGDLNIDRIKFKSIIEENLKCFKGVNFVYKNGTYEITRSRVDSSNNISFSYLDYIITYNMKTLYFDLEKPPGFSDHICLHLVVDEKEFRDIKVNKKLYFSFKKCKSEYVEIKDKLKKQLTSPNNSIENMNKFIEELKKRYRPHVKIPKGPFQWMAYYNNFIKFMEIYNENKNKNYIIKKKIKNKINLKKQEFIKFINEINEIEFYGILANIKKLQIDKQLKEFFILSKYYTDINKKVSVLNDLIIKDDDEDIVTVDNDKINDKITEKYKILFKDHGKKNIYEVNGDKYEFDIKVIEKEIKKLKKEKGISWDYIPHDSVINLLNDNEEEENKDKNNIDDKTIILNNIKNLFNDILFSDKEVTEDLVTARLILLNKNADQPGQLNAIRPISIYGPIFKLMERSLYDELYSTIVPKLSKNQVGFIGVLGTEVNLIKLRQNTFNLFKEGCKNITIIFVDFSNAYDSVNHALLFKKLEEEYNINNGLLNILKRVYSKARVRIDPLRDAININSGVLQGSILSPLLFNAFINDLLITLEKSSYDVLAYADDIAFICSNNNQLKVSIKLLKEWCNKNKMTLNLKKCGIMIIRGNINEDDIDDNMENLNLFNYNDKNLFNVNKLNKKNEFNNDYNLDNDLIKETRNELENEVYNIKIKPNRSYNNGDNNTIDDAVDIKEETIPKEDIIDKSNPNIKEVIDKREIDMDLDVEKFMCNILDDENDKEKKVPSKDKDEVEDKGNINELQNKDKLTEEYEGIPIVENYKYLGISFNNSFLPLKHLKMVNKKMKVYLKKNKSLLNDFFSLKSLKMLHQHFQESRLFYGMSVFIDIPPVVKMIEKLKMKYLLGMFDLYRQINKNLLNLILGMPKVEFLLFSRLIVILKKFVKHFNWRPNLYDDLISSYEDRLNGNIETDKEELKNKCFVNGVKYLAFYCDVKININYVKYRKLYFSFPDKRDILLVKFLMKSHIFARYLNKKCLLCHKPNEKDHLFRYCNDDRLKGIKNKYYKDIIVYLSEEEKAELDVDNFYKVIKHLYFNPKKKKDLINFMIVIKKFVFEVAMLLYKARSKGKKVIKDDL